MTSVQAQALNELELEARSIVGARYLGDSEDVRVRRRDALQLARVIVRHWATFVDFAKPLAAGETFEHAEAVCTTETLEDDEQPPTYDERVEAHARELLEMAMIAARSRVRLGSFVKDVAYATARGDLDLGPDAPIRKPETRLVHK